MKKATINEWDDYIKSLLSKEAPKEYINEAINEIVCKYINSSSY